MDDRQDFVLGKFSKKKMPIRLQKWHAYSCLHAQQNGAVRIFFLETGRFFFALFWS
jgi:hypothetical protein